MARKRTATLQHRNAAKFFSKKVATSFVNRNGFAVPLQQETSIVGLSVFSAEKPIAADIAPPKPLPSRSQASPNQP